MHDISESCGSLSSVLHLESTFGGADGQLPETETNKITRLLLVVLNFGDAGLDAGDLDDGDADAGGVDAGERDDAFAGVGLTLVLARYLQA